MFKYLLPFSLLILLLNNEVHSQKPRPSMDELVQKMNKQAGRKEEVATMFEELKERIVTLNQKNFDKIVNDRTKHVFVEFYANWCGHCKALIPHWQKLAEHFKDNPDVVIAKIDAEQYRDISSRYGIQGYPTLIWFAKGTKSGEFYRGKRDSETFVKWVNERLKVQFSQQHIMDDEEALRLMKKKEDLKNAEKKETKDMKLKEEMKDKSKPEDKIKPARAVNELKNEPISHDHIHSKQTETPPRNTPTKEITSEHENVDPTDEGHFSGHGSTLLFYQAWAVENAKSVLVLLHGLGDHSGSYSHIVNHLVPLSFSIYSFDMRGHGRSQGVKGHINDWNEYREDLRLFINFVKREENVKKVFLLGFDLGGLIALDYSIRFKPGLAGVIELSPLMQYNHTGGILGTALTSIWPSFSVENVASYSAFTRDTDALAAIKNDPLIHATVSVKLESEIVATIDWVNQHANELKIPILILHGTADTIVTEQTIAALGSKITNKTYTKYEGGFHRLFDDLGREKVLLDISNWLEKHL